MDMNGDGYPDYITDTDIEYTNRHGGRDGEIAGYRKGTNNSILWQSGQGNVSNILTLNSISNSNSKGFSGSAARSSSSISTLSNSGQGISRSEIAFTTTSLSTDMNAKIGVGFSFQKNTSTTTNSYVDVNSDGLPDRVYLSDNKLFVCLNLGYCFSNPTDWGLSSVSCVTKNYSEGVAKSANGGLNVDGIISNLTLVFSKHTPKILRSVVKKLLSFSGSLDCGINGSKTENYTIYSIRDVNMDGLPDKIFKNGDNYSVAFNTGDSFTDAITMSDLDYIFRSVANATSSNLNASITLKINFVLWSLRFTVGGGGNVSWGSEYTTNDLVDIDGDGYDDIVVANNDDKSELKVRPSLIAYTNKLQSVENPLGGSFVIDYQRSAASFDHPKGKWCMKTLTINDGVLDDEDTLRNEFGYEGGKYDRYEREFLGFHEVVKYDTYKENNVFKPYRGYKQTYATDNIYHKGILMASELYDITGASPRIYTQTVSKFYDYSVNRVSAAVNEGKYKLNPVVFTRKSMFENQYIVFSPQKYSVSTAHSYNASGQKSSLITSVIHSTYNTSIGTHGELISYKFSDKDGLNEDGSGTYTYRADIQYLDTAKMTLFCLPKSHTVYDGSSSKVLRKMEYYWWPEFASQLKTVINYIDDNVKAVSSFIYDQYGNIFRKTLPANSKSERMWYQYEYDPVYHMYPTKITDAFGYTYQMLDYDYRFGIPLKTIDINGNVMTQTVDNRGRIRKITGPNEYNASDTSKYTIKFEYVPQKIVKNGSSYSAMPYAITKHYDGTQTSTDKDLETVTFVDGFGRPIQVKKESVVDGTSKMIASGRAKYDAFGRVTEAYYPVVGEMTNKTVFDATFDNSAPPTRTTYDVLDRVTETILPDTSRTRMAYSIAEGKLLTRVTDANGKYQDTYTTGDGKTVKTVQYKAYNTSGIAIADSALITRFHYDAINQLDTVTDAKGKKTVSIYDLAGRRTQVTHPASGITTFTYDAAGNLIEKLTANLRNGGYQPIKYQYDFNRLKEINYPLHPENDVKYVYGTKDEAGPTNFYRAGRLKSLEDGSGVQEYKYGKQGEVTELKRTLVIPNQAVATYVTGTVYDSWNRLQSMTYPDGEVVNYSYNTGGLLTNVKSSVNNYNYVENVLYDKFEQRTYLKYGNDAETFYTYNDSNRVLSSLSVKSSKLAGTPVIMNNSYTYDAVKNITKVVNTGSEVAATGTISGAIGGHMQHNYKYDNLYRLVEAHGDYNKSNTTKNAHYDLFMGYDNMHNVVSKRQEINQNGVQFAGGLNAGYNFNYSINADNCQQISNIADSSYRYASGEQKKIDYKVRQYSYDANGNLLSINIGKPISDTAIQATKSRRLLWDEENRLLALNDNGYVSNYFYDAAGERTVKESFDNEGVYVNGALSGARTGSANFTAYINPYMAVNNGGIYTKHIYMGSQRITSKVGNFFTASNSPVENTALQAKYVAQTSKIKERFDSLGVKYSGIEKSGSIISGSTGTKGTYFYHPDHLGSSSLITDPTGAIAQHVEYVPFGETFIDERNSTWQTPYLFNAKERDAETGLHYYGARYYDSEGVHWLSVDPLKEEYPNIGSYVYCAGNPVKYVDPDGNVVNLATAGIGAGVGVLLGASIEIGMQLYQRGSVDNWRAVGGAALQGGITGGAAGLTMGASLAATAAVAGTANVVGGTANRAIQGQKTSLSNIAWDFGIGAVFGAASYGIGQLSSFNFAKSFYKNSGFSPKNAINHIRGIDFIKPVTETILKKGTVIRQWVRDGGDIGNYFTNVENGAKQNLGITGYQTERTLKSFILTEDTKVLRSSAAEFNGAKGGGTQYFSTELKNNVKPIN